VSDEGNANGDVIDDPCVNAAVVGVDMVSGDGNEPGGGGTPATGATAGTPGSWTPAGSTPPADVAALQAGSVTASPATAWTTGQYVETGDAAQASWTGTAWAAGVAADEASATSGKRSKA
jgi:hypothetical protein